MKKIWNSCKKFSKNLKNSNFSQIFLNPCKKFKKNLKEIQKNSKKNLKIQIFRNKNSKIPKNLKNFQNFFENSFFIYSRLGGGGIVLLAYLNFKRFLSF